MTYTVPITFIPGTNAKALEVNENFEYIQGILDNHLSRIDSSANSRFAVNTSQKTLGGAPNYFSVLEEELTLNASLANPFVYTTAKGQCFSLTAPLSFDLSSLADNSIYNVFVNESELLVSSCTLYKQGISPSSPSIGDVWLRTIDPLCAYVWNGSWQDTNMVFIGKVQLNSSVVSVSPVIYNSNGYNGLAEQNRLKLPLFCVNSASVDSQGVPNLIAFDSATSEISFNVGGLYPSIILTDAFGYSIRLTELDTYTLQAGLGAGTYNIFSDLFGNIELFNNHVYQQKQCPPDAQTNDIWLCTAVLPTFARIFDGTNWLEFSGVPLGKVVLS